MTVDRIFMIFPGTDETLKCKTGVLNFLRHLSRGTYLVNEKISKKNCRYYLKKMSITEKKGREMKLIFIALAFLVGIGTSATTDRYEAENALVDENSVQKIADEKVSGGYYINMKEGNLSFKVNIATAGFYSVWTSYSQPNDTNGKIQNLTVNGVSAGQISFPKVDTFVYIKASPKVKLAAGDNTIGITKSWGWVNIDYISLTPYEPTPFAISSKLVTPNASENAQSMYSFIKTNFQNKIISGVMTSTVMDNDGKYTPNKLENQVEVAWVKNASGKIPALLGIDFLHGTGLSSDGDWHKGYTNATLALAEEIYTKGGIPAYCWHWMDPSQAVETFYTESSNNTPFTTFDLSKAYTDPNTCEDFDVNSDEYKAIIRDIDIVAGYLKKLSDKGVPILWRPLHEAAGKWFWWGYKGPKACKALYRLLFERLTDYHKLNNLIWVWTTDEASDALDWYPGDEYVDIIGRDYYFYPREANHSSLVASFEKVKEVFGGRKIVALSENGSIPYPDSLISNDAGWAYFMPWNTDYTMDGWAHDNTANDWKHILNHDYVITLDEMPGWDGYIVSAKTKPKKGSFNSVSVRYSKKTLELNLKGTGAESVQIYTLNGNRLAELNNGSLSCGSYNFKLGIVQGMYLVRIKTTASSIITKPILVK